MNDFALDLSRFAEKAHGRLWLVIRKICLEIFSRVIKRTPVKTGRARANWQCSIGTPALGEIDYTDKNGSETISKMEQVVGYGTSEDQDLRLFLMNNVPYIGRLEDGSSQRQAPHGMVKTTLREYPGIVEKAANENG